MVVEDGLRTFGGELRCEAGGLLPPELVVVLAPHLVGPPIPIRYSERDPVPGEDLRECIPVERTRVGQRRVDLVAENLLEPARGERLTAQLPVRLRLLGVRKHLEALLEHQLVIQLAQPVLPRGVALEALAGEVVVVDDEDVRVRVSSCGVGMHRDQVVRTVHPLDQLHRHVSHPVEVFLLRHIELIGMECKDVGLELVLASVRLSEAFGASDEVLRRRTSVGHLHGEGRRPRLPLLDEPLPTLEVTAIEHVADSPCGARRRPDVHGAHARVRSPSEARTSSTAHSTSRRRSLSMAVPLRST